MSRDAIPMIGYDDFAKLEMCTGRIDSVERVPNTDKLYKIQVDIGASIQLVSSLVPYYSEDELVGKDIIVLVNLKPATFAGETSEGMLLCAESDDGKTCVLLTPEKDVPPGTSIT